MNKWVYIFSKEKTDGDSNMSNLLGGKGANLAEMSKLGLPVPPGFTITTEVCNQFYANEKKYPEDLESQVSDAIVQIERLVKNIFGSDENPLLVSVRSGARSSMPGMLDTVLNLGLNDKTVEGFLVKATPVALLSSKFPNTIACTFTAVPQWSGISFNFRYVTARLFCQDKKSFMVSF